MVITIIVILIELEKKKIWNEDIKQGQVGRLIDSLVTKPWSYLCVNKIHITKLQ